MLTLDNLQLTFKAIQFQCTYGFLPFHFDPVTAHAWPKTTRRAIWSWKFRYFLVIVSNVFKYFRFFQSLVLRGEYYVLNNVFLHGLYNALTLVINYGIFMLWYNRGLIASLFGRVHRLKYEATKQTDTGKIFSVKFLQTHSLLELTIITLPAILALAYSGVFMIFLMDTRAVYLVFTILPKSWQNPLTLILTLAIDMWILLEIVSIAFVGCYFLLQFTIPYMCNEVFAQLRAQIRWQHATNDANAEKYCRVLIESWIEVIIYNSVFATLTYCLKMMCLCMAVLGIFSGLHFHNVIPEFAAVMVFLGIYIMVIYMFLFGRSYLITDYVMELKQKIVMVTLSEPAERKYIEKILTSIPTIGIRAGSFYYLDRRTTPEFLDFVISQIVSLLVAFST